MKARIAELITALRRAEIVVSVAEAMDAAQAAAMAGVERSVLREALAATLVKDERDRPVFLAAFAATFPARVADVAIATERKRGRRSAASGATRAEGTFCWSRGGIERCRQRARPRDLEPRRRAAFRWLGIDGKPAIVRAVAVRSSHRADGRSQSWDGARRAPRGSRRRRRRW